MHDGCSLNLSIHPYLFYRKTSGYGLVAEHNANVSYRYPNVWESVPQHGDDVRIFPYSYPQVPYAITLVWYNSTENPYSHPRFMDNHPPFSDSHTKLPDSYPELPEHVPKVS